jgi:hypothetical protein
MYLTSEIVKDTLAARRFRLLAPLAVLLALAALTLAPGIIGVIASTNIWIDHDALIRASMRASPLRS